MSTKAIHMAIHTGDFAYLKLTVTMAVNLKNHIRYVRCVRHLRSFIRTAQRRTFDTMHERQAASSGANRLMSSLCVGFLGRRTSLKVREGHICTRSSMHSTNEGPSNRP